VVAEPVKLHVKCEEPGRTKACPEFLRGLADQIPQLIVSPLHGADLVLFVSAAPIANDDRLHFRLISDMPNAPRTIEFDVLLPTRASDDQQRQLLEGPFRRAVGMYVAARFPTAVGTEFFPDVSEAAANPVPGQPWSFEISLSGSGSKAGPYTSAATESSIDLSRTTPTSQLGISAWGNYEQRGAPPLIIDGESVSLNATTYSAGASAFLQQDFTPCWSWQVFSAGHHDDPEGNFVFNAKLQAAMEWNAFASNDPRGNKLAVSYHIGAVWERYRQPNALDELTARYPLHSIAAKASLRHDTATYSLAVSAEAELLRPMTRNAIHMEPEIAVALTDRIDLAFNFKYEHREQAQPMIDLTDYENLSQGVFAERESLSSSMSLRLHWDASNGAQNNRFEY
jgi:hypothetical protein